jgi:poly-gamma-glutamate capsule biosynthesis protein CapA/YwtB (metallophosphatase superfamily)
LRDKILKLVVLCLLTLSLSIGSAVADRQIVITFLGDCTLGGEDRLLYKPYAFAAAMDGEGYGYYFKNVKDLLSEDDLTVANLEVVLRDEMTGGSKSKTYVFRGEPEYTQILALGSVEAVGLENNHTIDFGQKGLKDTKQALTDAGISYFDMTDTYVYEKYGIRIAFLGLNGVQWADYSANGGGFVEKIQVLKADESIDAVVVALHYGEEYSDFHSEGQTKMAYRMIDAGADLVVGTHPHVLEGMEVYHDRLILYSIGNFVFGGNSKVRSMQTIIPRVTFSFSDDKVLLGTQLRIYPAHISGDNSGVDNDNNYQPVLVQGRQAQIVYYSVDRDSRKKPAPVLDTETDQYRDYQWINVTPQE